MTQKALIRFAKEHKLLTAILAVLLLIGIGAYLFFGNGGSNSGGDDLHVLTATPAEGNGEQATDAPGTVTPGGGDTETTPTDKAEPTDAVKPTGTPTPTEKQYTFRNKSTRDSHFEKHGQEFPYATVEEYVAGANKVIHSPDALHKIEKEDGDDIYYLEASNEFVVVSTDGYIRTYFKPSAGKAYFDRQ